MLHTEMVTGTMSATTAKLGSAMDTTPVTNDRHSNNLEARQPADDGRDGSSEPGKSSEACAMMPVLRKNGAGREKRTMK